MAVGSVSIELHGHAHTVHGIKDLVLAQNRDVHVLALKKLVNGENIDQDIFPEDVHAFARNYFKQKKELLFLNSNGVLCAKYPPSQRQLQERPCMIVMPQLYQHEILFRAHDAMGHQGISNVVARIQERPTWSLEFAAQWLNTLASVSLANRFKINLGTSVSTSRIFRVDTSKSWCNTII